MSKGTPEQAQEKLSFDFVGFFWLWQNFACFKQWLLCYGAAWRLPSERRQHMFQDEEDQRRQLEQESKDLHGVSQLEP